MSECDHIIAVVEEGEGCIFHVSDLGHFRYTDEIFKFCPRCGEQITLTDEDIKQKWDEHLASIVPNTLSLAQAPTTRKALNLLHNMNNLSLSIEKHNAQRIFNGLKDEGLIKPTIKIRLPNRYTRGTE